MIRVDGLAIIPFLWTCALSFQSIWFPVFKNLSLYLINRMLPYLSQWRYLKSVSVMEFFSGDKCYKRKFWKGTPLVVTLFLQISQRWVINVNRSLQLKFLLASTEMWRYENLAWVCITMKRILLNISLFMSSIYVAEVKLRSLYQVKYFN